MAAGFQFARDEHAATDARGIFFEDFEAEEAVIDEDRVADLDVVDEVLVVHVDGTDFLGPAAAFRAHAGAHGEVEDLADFELDGCGYIAGPDFGSLDVHHDGDIAVDALAHGPNSSDDHARPVVRGVRHVESDDIGAGADQLFEHLLALSGGPEGEDYFGAAKRVSGAHAKQVGGGNGRNARREDWRETRIINP
jgi:hypothetical protein